MLCRYCTEVQSGMISHEKPHKLVRIQLIIKHPNSTDESLTLWKGHLNFQQYLSLKLSQLRIQEFELYECNSGYLWSFIIYTGKEPIFKSPLILKEMKNIHNSPETLWTSIVDTGFVLGMGNYYNSLALVSFWNHGTLNMSVQYKWTGMQSPTWATEGWQWVEQCCVHF
jgi:hypothetical protein